LVIRKAGFQSAFLRTREASAVRITLQKITAGRTFQACPDSGDYIGIQGWDASFRFHATAEIKVGAQGQDVDYGIRIYEVNTKQGPKGITHGSGLNWSSGTPLDMEVWRSMKYEEAAYGGGPTLVIDARGQSPDGSRWRNLGRFGESASYSGVDESTAKILDKFLDAACLTASRL
jgi:hypothetical protein